MKFGISKTLEGGTYMVKISVAEISPEEGENIRRFGPPMISVSPSWAWRRGSGRLTEVPVHSLNDTFEFKTEREAQQFVEGMKSRLQVVVESIRSKKDRFSGSDEYEV